MKKKGNRDTKRAARIIRTAEIVEVSERQVQRVLSGDRENEVILSMYLRAEELELEMDNKLREEVKRIVPLN